MHDQESMGSIGPLKRPSVLSVQLAQRLSRLHFLHTVSHKGRDSGKRSMPAPHELSLLLAIGRVSFHGLHFTVVGGHGDGPISKRRPIIHFELVYRFSINKFFDHVMQAPTLV